MRVLIRPANPADIPAIAPMVQAVCDFHAALDPVVFDYLPDVVERYRSWLPRRAADPESVLLIAEDHADAASPRAVGFLVGEVLDNIPIYQTARYGFVHDLWVEPDARRKGVARALVIEAVRRFERMGVTQVRGQTAGDNEHARAMLRALGFRAASTEMVRPLP